MKKKLLIFIDLSGTLHIGDVAVSQSIEALKLLRENSDKFLLRFVTNTTKQSTKSLFSTLLNCGFNDVQSHEIFSSLSAAHLYLKEKNLRSFFFLENNVLLDFKDIDTNEPNAVVVGLAPSKFNFKNLNYAFKILLQSHTELIAIHKGRYYKDESNELSLGPGPFVECLEYASGKKAKIIGKPTLEFFYQAIKSVNQLENENFTVKNTIMIGDDVRDDVLGAINAGMQAILVKTGKYKPGDENEIPINSRICVENLYDAVRFIMKNSFY